MGLTSSKIAEIESKTSDILRDAYGKDPIVPPIELNRLLIKNDINLKFGNFNSSDVVGAYDKASKTIFIAESDPYLRQAFTVAHELGHYFLHKDKKTEVFHRSQWLDPSLIKTDQEREADWFAASLLMPKSLISLYFKQVGDIGMVANGFAVSSQAAFYRLKNLGLIK